MKINRVKCDQCGVERETRPTLTTFGQREGLVPARDMIHLNLSAGRDWTTCTATGLERETSFDFCSEACVGKFIETRSSLHNEKAHAWAANETTMETKLESLSGSNAPTCSASSFAPPAIYPQYHGDAKDAEPVDVRYVRWDLVARLLRDVMQIHADPNDAGHNQCDEDQCQWCEWASELFPQNGKPKGGDQ